MDIERVAIGSVRVDAGNVRKHGKKNLDAIKRSLEEFGQQKPIVVGADGVVVAGNGTLDAALALGWTHIDVVRTGLEGSARKAYAVADNRTAELAEWDDTGLAEYLAGLKADTSFDETVTGFDAAEIERLIGSPEIVEDEAPPVPEKPVTRPGDLWLLGDHRMLCGDATKAEDVERLMDGASGELSLTDPPYSVDYDRSQAERGGSVKAHAPYREAGQNPSDILSFLGYLPTNVLVMTYPLDRHQQALACAFRRYDWELRKECVWVKDRFSFWPGATYQQRHEPILICARRGEAIGGAVPANASTVFEVSRPRAHDEHATARPLALWIPLMQWHSDSGAIVYDPVVGHFTDT